MEKARSFFSKRKDRIMMSILAAVTIPLMVFVVAPFEIYCSNISEFKFSLSFFFPLCLAMFAATFIGSFFLLYLIPEKLFRIVYAGYVATSLLIFIQQLFLNSGIHSLSGDNIESAPSKSALLINTIIWAAVEIAFIILFFKKSRSFVVRTICTVICVSIIGTQLINFTVLSLSTENAYTDVLERSIKKDPDYQFTLLTDDNITNISSEKNVFVFVSDRFDKGFAEIAFKKEPDIFSELDGFTFFEDNISLYTRTYPSITYMITGNEFKNEKREDYLNNAFKDASPLEELKKNGYQINFYSDLYYAYTEGYYTNGYFSNAAAIPNDEFRIVSQDPLNVLVNSTRISLYRCLPTVLKSKLGKITSQSLNKYVSYYNGETVMDNTYICSADMFEDKYIKKEFVSTDDKVFSFIHTEGCHDLYFAVGSDGEVESKEEEDETLKCLRRDFDVINTYIRRMKETGVYKDATIIITGDHNSHYGQEEELGYARNTALFVKPSGVESGGITRSSAQVCHGDLWATIFKSADIDTDKDYGRSVFDIEEDEVRTRTYHWQYFPTNGSYVDSEYTITGSALDFSNWHLTDKKEFDRKIYD